MIWAIYPRKSKERDGSVSMDMQVNVCKDYINRIDKKAVINIYGGDYGISGHAIKNRKDFQRLMQDVKGGKIQGVAIYKYDRIARNMYDFVNLCHDLEEANCVLVSATQNIDTSTPAGKQMVYTLAGWAEYEYNLNSERRKDANKYASQKGICTLASTSIPFGYKAEIIDGVRRMVIDKEKEPIVRDIYHYYDVNMSINATLRYVNDKYGFEWTNRRLRTILLSPVFHGEYRGNKNYCPAYLTEAEHNRIMSHREKYIRPHDTDEKYYLFGGLIKCPRCGYKLTPTFNGTSKTRKYYMYKCNHTYRDFLCDFRYFINEEYIEKELLELINAKMSAVKVEVEAHNITPVKKELKDHAAELDRLTKSYIKGRINEEFYEAEYARLEKEIAASNKEEIKHYSNEELKTLFPASWETAYNELTRENKKLFWSRVLDNIEITEDKHVAGVSFR